MGGWVEMGELMSSSTYNSSTAELMLLGLDWVSGERGRVLDKKRDWIFAQTRYHTALNA